MTFSGSCKYSNIECTLVKYIRFTLKVDFCRLHNDLTASGVDSPAPLGQLVHVVVVVIALVVVVVFVLVVFSGVGVVSQDLQCIAMAV